MRRFELHPFLEMLEKYQITELTVVPPMVVAIVMSPYAKSRPFMKSIKYAVCGAAPLDKDLQHRLVKLIGSGAFVNQVWGMTETSCIATEFPTQEKDESGSVGRPIPNLQLK